MFQLLFVTCNKDAFSELASTLEIQDEIDLSWVESGGDALDKISNAPVDLVITDEKFEDMTGLELAFKLLYINPMVNCAAISSLSHEDFHEASEGLGLLAQLPPKPGKKEAEELITQLKELKNLAAES